MSASHRDFKVLLPLHLCNKIQVGEQFGAVSPGKHRQEAIDTAQTVQSDTLLSLLPTSQHLTHSRWSRVH